MRHEVIKVLHIDGEPKLLEICKHTLELNGTFQVDTENNSIRVLDLINKKKYEAIVSEYQMPGINGMDLLKSLRDEGNNIPFIFYTAKDGDDIVIQALNNGADYFLKKGSDPESQFIEIGNKICSIVVSGKRNAEREHEDRYRILFDAIAEPTFQIEKQTGMIIRANPSALSTYGYSLDEITSLRNKDLSAEPEKTEQATKHIQEVIPLRLHRKKDGTIFPVEINSSTVEIDGRTYIIASARDITKRIMTDEALKNSDAFLRQIFENSPVGIEIYDKDGVLIDVNKSCMRIFGIKDISAVRGFNLFEDPNVDEASLRELKQGESIHHEQDFDFDLVISRNLYSTTRNGKIKLDVQIAPIIYSDQTKGYLVILQDITERKLAEENLRKSEEKFRATIEQSSNGVVIIDKDFHIMEWNDSQEKMFGLSKEELSDKDILEWQISLFPVEQRTPELLERMKNGLEKMANASPRSLPLVQEIEIELKGGIKKNIHSTIFPITTPGDRFYGIITQDVTERRRIESSLIESNLLLSKQTSILRFLNKIVGVANSSTGPAQLFSDVLDEVLLALDFDSGGIYLVDENKGQAKIVHFVGLKPDFVIKADNISINQAPYHKLFVQGEPIISEYYDEMVPSQAAIGNFLSMASVPLTSAGRIIGALNVASHRRHKISGEELNALVSIGKEIGNTIDRMIVEEHSIQVARDFQALFDSITEMVFILDGNMKILEINKAVTTRLHYSNEELIGNDVLFIHVPERRDEALEIVNSMFEGSVDSCQIPLITKENEQVEVETKVTKGWWKGREVLIGVSRDVTRRKKAEDSLIRVTNRLEQATRAGRVGIWEFDVENNSLTWDDQMFQLYGVRKEQFSGVYEAWREALLSEDELKSDTEIQMALRGEKEFDTEFRIRWPDGSIHNIRALAKVYRDASGKPLRMIGTNWDITTQKQMEMALIESEKKFKEIFNSANDAIQLNLISAEGGPGRCVECNEVACRMVGYSHQEMLQMTPFDFDTGFHDPPLPQVITDLHKQGHVQFETDHIRKDGIIIPVEINAHIVTMNGTNLILSVIRDITNRKRDEMALKEAFHKNKILTSITRHDIKNQLQVLTGNLDLLKLNNTDNKLDKQLHNIVIAAENISSMIQFTKEYENIGLNAAVWHNINESIAHATEVIPLEGAMVVDEIPSGIRVLADPMLTKVFLNLIQNAVRHGGKVTTIRFFVGNDGEEHTIVCEDDGNGIPIEMKNKLFSRGFGIDHGLGLFLSREILSITGIRISENGRPGKGARFVLIIPKKGLRKVD